MNVVENESGMTTGTGAMIQVLDLDGNVVAEYVFIVFGDANGDGIADGADASMVEEHDAWLYGDNGQMYSYQAFACDVNVDEIADPADASMIEEHDAWLLGDSGRIDVAGIIATLGF